LYLVNFVEKMGILSTVFCYSIEWYTYSSKNTSR